MRQIIALLAAFVMLGPPVLAQVSPIQMSILPNGRSGGINEPVTYFATIVSTAEEALTCAPRFGGFMSGIPAGTSAQARFYAWDGATITGAANADVIIPAGGRQDFVVSITIDRAFTGPLSVVYRCQNAGGDIFDLPRLPLVNDFHIRVANGDQPDILVIADTLSQDGVARVGATGPRAALMTVAAINIGDAAANVAVRTEITGFSLLDSGLTTRICETDAAGQCFGPQSSELQIENWAANETRFFAVRTFIPRELPVPFFPDVLRLAVLFDDNSSSAASPGLSQPTMYKTPGVYIAEVALFAPSVAEVESAIPAFIGYQCHSRPDADTSAAFERFGGVILVGPDPDNGGELGGRGYLIDSLLDFEARFAQPVELIFPTSQSPDGLTRPQDGTGRIMVLGGDEDDVPQAVDAEQPVVITTPFGALVLRHDGTASFEGFYSVPGRSQCAPIPAPPSAPTGAGLTATTNGRHAAAPNMQGNPEVEVDEQIGISTGDEGQLIIILNPNDDPATNVAAGIFGGFIALSAPGHTGQDVDGQLALDPENMEGWMLPLNFRPGPQGGVLADCITVMVSNFPSSAGNSQALASDAGVFVLTRDGAVLSDAQRELCLP
jgi:hypothetical protein